MSDQTLTALSPLDGRYANKLSALRPIFSEYALIYYRVFVEIHWLKALCAQPKIPEAKPLSIEASTFLDTMLTQFNLEEAQCIKQIESITNHDVKAVEYYLKQKFEENDELKALIPFLHFACTSEDINNLSYALMISRGRTDVLLPTMHKIIEALDNLSTRYAAQPMLAHTHGQPATTTTVGKEFINFKIRLQRQHDQFAYLIIYGKCNGATGNFNAHHVAYPYIDWPNFVESFIESLGLPFNAYVTQIEPHDCIAQLMQCLVRFNTILLDLSRDCWAYISMNYFQQQHEVNEVGSSTMPHKVNPIDFENAEGNLGLANALANHLAEKLPISRLQRDLSDSTVLRNIGSVFGYSMLAWESLLKGLQKISPNRQTLQDDLQQHWEILGEAIQTVLRKHGVADAYERLKNFSRGKAITRQALHDFIEQLPLPVDEKQTLLKLTPESYTGYAEKLVCASQINAETTE
ncbi:MAG: adenylosuccinate lyase [Gammaproteobacteria bacterium RIFCSPHIGHO2_12_FULL_41_15]|nr:MAG: adenylosuccinate lyase [Gammaproteobacteria bacterium RIFCSPHIGHO2_12_FULL_41_15]